MKIINLLAVTSFFFLTGAMENPPGHKERGEPGCPYAPWMSDDNHTQLAEKLTDTESLSSWAIKSLLQDSHGLEKIEQALEAGLINTEVEDMLLHALVKSHKLSLLQFFWSDLNGAHEAGVALPATPGSLSLRNFVLPSNSTIGGAGNADQTVCALVDGTRLTMIKLDKQTRGVQSKVIFENIFSKEDVLLAAKLVDERFLNLLVAPYAHHVDGKFGRGLYFLQFDLLEKKLTSRKELFKQREKTYILSAAINSAGSYALFVHYSLETHTSCLVICSLKTGEAKELRVKNTDLIANKVFMFDPKTGTIVSRKLEAVIGDEGDLFCSKIKFFESGKNFLIKTADREYTYEFDISSYVYAHYKLADIVCILQQIRDNPA